MRFMAQATMKQELTEKDYKEAMELLPAQRARDKELEEQGIKKALYVAADRSIAWMVLNGESQDQVQEILQTFPLYRFSDYVIKPLTDEEA
jgi:muconolactone delta-isomerase